MVTEAGAHSNEDCLHGLLKWVAQPDAEAGKGMGTVLSPTSHDA